MSDTTAEAPGAPATNETTTTTATPATLPTPPTTPPAGDEGDLPKWARAQLTKANKEAERYRQQLREREESEKTEAQKLADRAAQAEARATALEAQVARDQIARDKGLAGFAEFLSGDTADDIAASADRLLDRLAEQRAPGRPVEALQSGVVPAAQQAPADVDSWIRNAVSVRQHGGR